MKNVKVFYISSLALVAGLFALFQYDVLPIGLIPADPENLYAVNLVSSLSAFGGCFLLLYYFRIPSIRSVITDQNEEKAERAYVRFHYLRLAIWLILTVTNVALYFQCLGATNPKYCYLVLCLTGIFLWPEDRTTIVNSHK